jgi:hypothetical protein
MKSKHTLPTVVTNQWIQDDKTADDTNYRRTTGNLDSWAINAEFWDKVVGDGNDMYQELVLPCVEELAELKPGMGGCVLDLATGNGLVARALRARVGSSNGARVIASDGCAELLQLAQERERAAVYLEGEEVGKRENVMEYEQLDLMDEVALEAFVKRYAGYCYQRSHTNVPLSDRRLGAST